MKLQVSGQHWRVRINEDELACLRDGRTLVSDSALPGDVGLCFTVQLATSDHPAIALLDGRWSISLPAASVEAYIQRLPCRDGVAFRVPVTANVALELVLEVDVRDSVRRRGVVSRRPS